MNSKIVDCAEGEHDWEWEKPNLTSGPNIFGVIVSCWGSDGICQVCGTTSWKRVAVEEDI